MVQFFVQGLLCSALMVGKLSIGDHWFLEFDVMIILFGYEAGRHFPRKHYLKGGDDAKRDIYSTGARLAWHRDSMYHYFSLTAVQAYLSVSGTYRMLPAEDRVADVCNQFAIKTISIGTKNIAVYGAGFSFVMLVISAGWLTISHFFNYQSTKRDHATILAFADAFKNMLERRRRRMELAFDRNSKSPRAGAMVRIASVPQTTRPPVPRYRKSANPACSRDGRVEGHAGGVCRAAADARWHAPAR